VAGDHVLHGVLRARTGGLTVFGWPLSFYMAAQGAALIYLAILGVYALAHAPLDRATARRSGGER
jgi:putative solute:sodium symporter small subunit